MKSIILTALNIIRLVKVVHRLNKKYEFGSSQLWELCG